MNYDIWGLFTTLLAKELKAKYKNTILGYAWSLFMPILQSLIFFVVFSLFLRFAIEDYFLFLLIGCTVWQFFSNSIVQGANVLIANSNLIRKTRAPRWIFVAASTGAEAVHLLISLPILLGIMILCDRVPAWSFLYMLPLGIFALLTMTLGLALLSAGINAYFRDVERILQILLQVWFYATPIFYSIAQVPMEYRYLFKFNPVYYPVVLFRSTFYSSNGTWQTAIMGVLSGLFLFSIGITIFRVCQKKLPEVL